MGEHRQTLVWKALKSAVIIITLWNTKITVIPIVICALGTIPKKLGKRTGRLGNKRKNGDHPDNSIIKVSQNTEKRPEN